MCISQETGTGKTESNDEEKKWSVEYRQIEYLMNVIEKIVMKNVENEWTISK